MLDQVESLASAILDWLLTSASGGAHSGANSGVLWHGRLMTATWLVLVPFGILIARFYKVTSRQDWPNVLDNPLWFVWHRRLGWLAMVLTALAMAAIILRKESLFAGLRVHAVAGWTVVVLCVLQVVGALLRGSHGGPIDPFTRARRPPEQWAGDHYCMTKRRIAFEYSHKLAGYLVVPVTLVAIVTGLSTVDAPRWMWFGFIIGCAVFAIVFVRLQGQGRCRDTYQAIWGTDPALPGNQRAKPIGWGINRVTNTNHDRSEKDAG